MRRLKRVLAWCGAVLLAVALSALALNAWWNRSASTSLQTRLEALRKSGAPLTWDDVRRDPAATEDDAAEALRGVRGELDQLAARLETIVLVGSKRTLRLNASQQQAVEKALAAHPTVLPHLEQAAARAVYRPAVSMDPQSPDFGPSTEIRNACRVLRFRAFLSLARGQRQGAMAAAIDQFRLAGLLRDGALRLSDYVAGLSQESLAVDVANAILQAGPLSMQAHRELESALARCDDLPSLRRALAGQRLLGQTLLRTHAEAGGWFGRWVAVDQECHFLDLIAEHLDDLQRPYAEVRSRRPPAAAPSVWSTRSIADSMRPTLETTIDGRVAVLAKVRCLRLLNAIVAHGYAGRTEPPSTAELELPPECSADPFTDKPLVLRRLPDGWLLYGTGPDLVDDGGSLSDGRDVGLAPDGYRADSPADSPALSAAE